MAIPRYDSRESLTTEVGRAPEDPSKMTTLGKEVGEVGEGLESIGDQMTKLRDFQQKSSAMHLLRQSVQKRYVDTINNKDVWGSLDKVDEGFMTDIENSSTHITDSTTRDKFKAEAQSYIDRKSISLEMAVRNKQSQLTKATTIQQMDEQVEDILSSHPNEHAVALDEFKKYTEEAIGTSGVNEAALRTHYNHLMRTLPEKMLTSDIGRADSVGDPKSYLKGIEHELNKPDGWYKNMPAEKKDWAYKQLSEANKRVDATVKTRQKADNAIYVKSAAELLSNGALTSEWVMKNASHLTPTQLEHYNNAAKKLPSETDNPTEVAECLKTLIDPNSTEQDYIEKMAEYAGNQKLNPEENSMLYELGVLGKDKDPVFKTGIKAKIDQLIKAQKESEAESKKTKEGWRGAWNTFWGITGGNTKETVDMVKATVKNKGSNDSIETAAATTIKNKSKSENPTLTDVPHSTMSMKEGLRDVWQGDTSQKADYKIKNGEVVPKAKAPEKKRWTVGQVIDGTGKYAGKKYKVIDAQGNTEEVKDNANSR